MFSLRRLLLSAPVAALLCAGAAFGDEPAKAAPASPAPAMVIAGQPCQSCAMPVSCCEPAAPKIGFFADYLYLKNRNNDIPFARPVDDLTTLLPTGPVGQVSQDWEQGYRFGGWYAPTTSLVLRATFTSWESDQTATIVAPDVSILQSLVALPNAGNAAVGYLEAGAASSIEMKIIDLDAAFTILGGCDHAGRLAGVVGFRYATLDQNFGSLFLLQGTEFVGTSIEFEGYGPRMGLEGDVSLTRGIYAYGSGVLSLLVGQQSADYLHTDIFRDVLVNTSYDKDRISAVFDLEFGLGVTCCKDHLNLRVGYLISSWGNLVTTNGLVQSVQQGDFTTNRDNLRDNLTFDGFTARVEFRW